jgi:molybdopterin-guanine dinucleotide biosynthesis protein A
MTGADFSSPDRAVTGAILAGGKSTRMGTNKALLSFGGRSILEGLLGKMRPLFPEMLLIANDPAPYRHLGLPVYPDRIPEKGSLGGIYTALHHSAFHRTFCIACDMPLADPRVIGLLCDLAPDYDVVVPRTPEGYQPLHAVYSRSCLPHIEAMIRADRLKIDRLFPQVRVRTVGAEELRALDPSLHSFVNVNTPEELEAAARLHEGAFESSAVRQFGCSGTGEPSNA